MGREAVSHGGSKRLQYTSAPLVFNYLQLARRIRARELAGVTGIKSTTKKVFQAVHEICTGVAAISTELALKLFVQAALAADAAGFGYEFFSQAFLLYEDVHENKSQVRYLQLLITSLLQARGLDIDSYENLASRCTQLSIKVLLQGDKVRLILLATRLFWRGQVGSMAEYQRPKETLQCLQKAFKLAQGCMPAQPALFVDILDGYLYFFEKKCQTVTASIVNDLIAWTREQILNMPSGAEAEEAAAHLRNTLAHVRLAKASKEASALYADVDLA